jgi:hypothetical protein
MLDLVYRRLLKNLPLVPEASRQLRQRGLTKREVVHGGYGYLDTKRRLAVQAVIDAGLGKHLPTVPGFYREDGLWRFSGPRGVAIPVRDRHTQIVAIKVRAENPESDRKYSYSSSKKHKGPSPGSPIHVPVHGADDEPMCLNEIRITEGELKADIATARTNVLTLGLPGVAAFRKAAPIIKALGGKTVIIAFDADYQKNETVATALCEAIQFFSKGFDVVVEQWPAAWGKGIDDVLVAGKTPRRLKGKKVKSLLRKLKRRANGTTAATRPQILVTTEEKQVNDDATAALANDATIYQRGGVLVHVVHDNNQKKRLILRPKGTPRIALLAPAVLRERLAEAAEWLKMSWEKVVPAHVPNWSVNAIHARGHWEGIRPLEGIVTGPVLRADGSILAAPGYDTGTGLLCKLDLKIPDIPSQPKRADIHKAVACLDDAIADFPFESPVHRATWFAMLLTLLARPAFVGPTPLFLFDANVRGAGKGLLFDLAAVIATGRGFARTPHPTDKEETRKLIMAIALAGDPTVMLDNVAGEFGNSALEAALTSTMWHDRILGESKVIELPLMPLWAATGNNVILTNDMPRRVAPIRLRSPLENPEDRTDFRHQRLLRWAERERSQLLAAALVLLRGYWVAGKPDQHLTNWGSYEGWSDLVRAAVVWAGLPDPAEARKTIARQDPTINALKAIMNGLRAFDPGGAGLTTSDIVEQISNSKTELAEAMRDGLVNLCKAPAGGLPAPQIIGIHLGQHRERVVGGMFINSRQRNNTAAWYVAESETGVQGASGASPGRSRNEIRATAQEAQVNMGTRAKSPRSPRSSRSEDVEVF